jgi:hypothetical protein
MHIQDCSERIKAKLSRLPLAPLNSAKLVASVPCDRESMLASPLEEGSHFWTSLDAKLRSVIEAAPSSVSLLHTESGSVLFQGPKPYLYEIRLGGLS